MILLHLHSQYHCGDVIFRRFELKTVKFVFRKKLGMDGLTDEH